MANDKSARDMLIKRIKTRLIPMIVVVAIALILAYFMPEEPQGDNVPETPATSENQGQTSLTPEVTTEVNGELILTMIDVGQADSFLLEQGDMVALVDCGTRSTGKNVVNYLNEQGITRIDYLFGTHPHDDHMGGMYDVITNVEIGKVIIPKVSAEQQTSAWYMKLMNELKNGRAEAQKTNYGGYDVEYVTLGTVYELGDATIKVIGPMDDYYNNLNNYSTVLKVSFGEMDIIMTGDAETQVEAQILESGEALDAEILKMGHHGSDTSSSDEFLEAISPQYALISAGIGNKYNHPIKSTMEKLMAMQIEVYRTDESGTVVVTITPTTASFSTEPDDYLSGPELKERDSQ